MRTERIEDIYDLSPVQAGMLFHSLYDADAGVYFNQMTFTIQGELHVDVLQRAWQVVVDRHPALRTGFFWEDLSQPLQVVQRGVEVPFDVHDWRNLDPTAQETATAEFLVADRARGFVLDEPPLLRLAVCRLAADTWQVIWSYHHLVLDGWSLAQVLSDVLACYDALEQGRSLPLVPARPFRDYMTWLQAQDQAAATAFWQEMLAGVATPTPLPGDRGPHTADRTHATAEQQMTLDAAATAALQAWARQHQLTVNTLVLGAWTILLSRTSGEADVLCGTTVSGRPAELPGVERVVGMFINTLPLRVRVDPAQPVVDWLHAVQARQAAMRQFEYSPLVDVMRCSALPPQIPLFESIVVFENYPIGDALANGARIRLGNARAVEVTNYPLTVTAMVARELWLGIGYDTRRFHPVGVQRLLQQLRILLAAIVTQPGAQVGDLQWLAPDERLRIVETWNATAAPYPQGTTLPALLRAQALRTPDAPALRWLDQTLTYRDLLARAAALGWQLAARGIGPGSVVAICLARGLAAPVALLGVWQAGAAYLPLDPEHPPERLAFMLADSRACLVLTQTALADRLPAAVESIFMDTWSPAQEGLPEAATPDAPSPASPLDVAYVIYTSGSTGLPKGVMVPHRALVNHATAIARYWLLSPADRVLQFSSLSFDVAAEEFYPTWLCGGTVVLQAERLLSTFADFMDLIDAERLTVLNIPAAYWHAWVDELLRAPVMLPASLRIVIVGDEAVHPAAFTRWAALAGDRVRLANAYGLTEATITSTLYEAPPGGLPAEAASVPIGRPVANTRAYILDRHLQPVPVGVPGELFIGGDGLAYGYLDRAALTAARFVPDPFARAPGERLYRTGDRARFLADGSIEFLGRSDDQVKIRGFRVEPGEVESVLRQHAAVREAAVMVQPHTSGDGRLLAYVVPVSKIDIKTNEIDLFLAGRLPAYMLPAAIVLLDTLPRTASGKLDRQALPAAAPPPATEGLAWRTRWTPTEQVIAAVWSEVLHVPRVGLHDNFFALGGHSLTATQVIARLRSQLQVDLTLRDLFEAPGLTLLAARVEAMRQRQPDGNALPPLLPSPDAGHVVSFAQERLWFLDQLEQGSAHYNLPLVLRLGGSLDVAGLHASLTALVARHAALRTTFVAHDGRPQAVVHPPQPVDLHLVDVTDRPQADRWVDVRRLARAEIDRPFDLADGPLLRAVLYRLASDDHVLLITVHHIVADGWSLGILVHDLSVLYQAQIEKVPPVLPALPVQYTDYAHWQRRWLDGNALAAHLDFWQTRLAGAPGLLELPTDRPRPAVQSFRGGVVTRDVPADLAANLRAFSQQEGVTLFMTLLAGYATLLYRYSGQDDILIGTPVANRPRLELEDIVGLFLNTLVLRTRLGDDPSFRQLLEQVKTDTLDAYVHQDVPFERLVEQMAVERSLSHTPLFQVMFNLETLPPAHAEAAGLHWQSLTLARQRVQFDLVLTAVETQDGLQAALEYSTDLFDGATAERLLGHYVQLLTSVVADPDQRITEARLLSAAEWTQLVHGWNATGLDYPRGACVHELVEAQVARTPHAPAVCWGGETLTYAALDERANQLAHALQGLGVGPEVLVGVCLERSAAMVVTVLGVLKAGGAYVPLDPGYPAARLAMMLADGRPRVVVTQDKYRSLVSGQGATVLCLDTDGATLAGLRTDKPEVAVSGANRAYVIFTSGSTGRPKGVQITHQAVVNFLLSMAQAPGLGAHDRLLAVTTLSFDIAGLELYLPLIVGGQVEVASREMAQDAEQLKAALPGVSVMQATPATWRLLLEADWAGNPGLKVLCGGEALPGDLLGELLVRSGAVWNLYGPTETTIWSTVGRLVSPDAPVTIGRPIANTRVYVLDRRGQPVPIGVAGELYLGGEGLSWGYLGQPGMTAAKFVPDPFAGEAGARMYHTGDVARYREDGRLEYLGRVDQQVKVRGYRIELGEIEGALAAVPGVRQAVVVAQAEGMGSQRLVAYLVVEPGADTRAAALRTLLKARLPEYMIPAVFVTLDRLPLTPNGKVDRRSLPAPDALDAAPEPDAVGPRSPLEAQLLDLWQAVLGRPVHSVHDNFFALGGHSLMATQVMARVRSRFDVEVSLRTLFEAPTVAGLAEAIVEQELAQADPALLAELVNSL